MPVCFVIFGVTGDLARSKLIPAIYRLYQKGLLPKKFKVVGYSRRPISNEEFRKYVAGIIKDTDSKFLKKIIYVQGQFNNKTDYKNLGANLSNIDDHEFGECSHKLFYLAVPPEHYKTIAIRLSESGLTIPCGGKLGWTRILLEKPFGHDIITARKLNLELGKLFKEEQIFRIDHYLAKEASQNILDFRFKNKKDEKFWNARHIKKVKVFLLEKKGVGDRGDFYDSLGALRDVGQNHLLQMLALVSMERPAFAPPTPRLQRAGKASVGKAKKLEAKYIRLERARLLEKIIPVGKKNFSKLVRRGQYSGYRQEEGVKTNSKTETYFKIQIGLATRRWRGTEFILESGKAMPEDAAGISVYFKDGKRVDFDYKKPANGKFSDAYEKVLYDCVRGDQTIFNTTREVEAAWEFVTPILKNWQSLPLTIYN